MQRTKTPEIFSSILIVLLILSMVSQSFAEGNGLILVLGGGGARGMTHIGVLKVLDEENIPIKLIIGTSAGAMVGGAYAAGLSPAEMEKRIEDIRLLGLVKIKPFGNLGFVSWDNIQLWLGSMLPVQTFKETRLPFYAVATDLSTGEAVLFHSGSLIEAMCASAAIPLVFQPVTISGKIYVDGGIAADLPIDIARSLGEEPILAVIATGSIEGMTVDSKWDIFSKSFYIMQHREIRMKRHLADLILEPKVGTFSMADMKHHKEIISAGEKAARDALPQIRKLLNK